METEKFLSSAQELLTEWTIAVSEPESNRKDFKIAPENLKPAVQKLIDAHWGYLITITGLDQQLTNVDGTKSGMLELLYHFAVGNAIATLRIDLPYDEAKIESICAIIPSATIYEREIIDLFGVEIVDTPSTEHLILPEHWPDGVYPLRKSFTGLEQSKEA